MIASGLMPRSPVWLRKIPSTVSGSQGSRRGLRPAVRFAFPLGARLNTTLRARPCQELFSESFSGRPAGRGAPRLPGFGPSRRRVRYYTRPRRGGCGKPARTQDADNSSTAERKDGGGFRMRGRHRAGASPRPACEVAHIQLPIYRQEDRPCLRAGSLPCRHASRASPVAGFPLLASAKLLAEAIPRKKNGRLRARPPSARAIPSATVPGRFSLYIYRDMFSSDCRRCAWSSLPNAATRPWGRLSLQACSQSSP